MGHVLSFPELGARARPRGEEGGREGGKEEGKGRGEGRRYEKGNGIESSVVDIG